jgi:ribosomal protein S18 acetylase RimI-like enzyme
MPIKIRAMKPSDKLGIMEILKITEAFTTEEVNVAEEVIDAYLADIHGSGYYIYVAESAGHILGYLCYGPTPMTQGTWDYYWMATAPEHRGKGIGSTLLKLAEQTVREADGRMILIETSSNPHYSPARNLYHSLGYEIISTIPDFYSVGDDKITFRKTL